LGIFGFGGEMNWLLLIGIGFLLLAIGMRFQDNYLRSKYKFIPKMVEK